MNVCAFVLIAVGVCVNSRSCLYVLHTRGANTQKCKRYIQQGNSERPRASPPNTCAHTHTHRPPSQIIPLIIEFLIDSRWTKTSSAFKLIGLVDFSPTEGNRRWSWHWKRGLQVMSWWAQVTFCSHFQLWERELLNLPGGTGNWNNKLLERKWNFDTATRFVRLANDLAPFWAVYLCTLAGFGQTEKCRPPPQYTHWHIHIHPHSCSQRGFSGSKWWHDGDRFWEVYPHVWSKVSAVGECLPSMRPSIPERTLLPSCLLHLILWPELAVRASCFNTAYCTFAAYHGFILQDLIK